MQKNTIMIHQAQNRKFMFLISYVQLLARSKELNSTRLCFVPLNVSLYCKRLPIKWTYYMRMSPLPALFISSYSLSCGLQIFGRLGGLQHSSSIAVLFGSWDDAILKLNKYILYVVKLKYYTFLCMTIKRAICDSIFCVFHLFERKKKEELISIKIY